MESEALDAERFIPLLRSHMTVPNPYVRQLLVGWITALDSAPGVDMLEHLAELLEGLFAMLSDGNREIRQQAYAALSTFLSQISKLAPGAWAAIQCCMQPHCLRSLAPCCAGEFAARIAFRPMIETLITQTSENGATSEVAQLVPSPCCLLLIPRVDVSSLTPHHHPASLQAETTTSSTA